MDPEPKIYPPVSILIPSHPSPTSKRYLKLCLESLDIATDKTKTPYEILVEEEGTFTQAVNSLCKKAKYDRLVYVANDMILTTSWLEMLHVSWDMLIKDKNKIGQLGTYFTLGGGNWQDAALGRFRHGIIEPCPKFVWMVTMMDKKSFEEVGLMDTRFTGAWSDTDLSARFIKAGYQNFMAPLILLHFGQGSWDKKWDKMYHESVLGEKVMREKHGKDWKRIFGVSA